MGLSHLGWSYNNDTKLLVDYLNDFGYDTIHIGLQHETAFHTPQKNRYKDERRTHWDDEHVEQAVDQAIDFLKARQSENTPFNLNIGTTETHSSQWNRKNTQWHNVYGTTPRKDAYIQPYIPDTPELRDVMGNFQACIRYYDFHIGRLLKSIKDLGYHENTLVVLTTDHGIANMRAKGTLYHAGVEIFGILSMPGVLKKGDSVNDLLQTIDVMPTLLDFVGTDIPETVQGKSFLPRLLDEDYQPHEEIFIERNFHGGKDDPIRAVRTNKYHLIKNFDPNGRKEGWLPSEVTQMNKIWKNWWTELWPPLKKKRKEIELFDIEQDPWCMHDLSKDPQYQAVKETLLKKMETWMKETNDPLLKGRVPKPEGDFSNWIELGGHT